MQMDLHRVFCARLSVERSGIILIAERFAAAEGYRLGADSYGSG